MENDDYNLRSRWQRQADRLTVFRGKQVLIVGAVGIFVAALVGAAWELLPYLQRLLD